MGATQTGVGLEWLAVRRGPETCRARCDRRSATASVPVVRTVTEGRDVGPDDLEALHHAVDADAPDDLLGGPDGAVRTSFAFEALEIAVSGGMVSVSPGGSTRPPDHDDESADRR